MLLPCSYHVLAKLLPCSCHVLARLLPHSCHALAMLLACSLLAMLLPFSYQGMARTRQEHSKNMARKVCVCVRVCARGGDSHMRWSLRHCCKWVLM
jgi:hypothetical protein